MYTKIEEQFWSDEKMLRISYRAKYLLIYLLTSPHRNILCFYFLPKPYACFDMGISPEEFDHAMAELTQAGRILYDPKAHVVCVKNYLKYNSLDNANQVKSAISKVSELPENELFESFMEHLKTLKNAASYKALIEAIGERLHKRLGKPLTKPLDEGSLIQITDNSKQITDNREQKAADAGARANIIPSEGVSSIFDAFSNKIHPISKQVEADGLNDLLDTFGSLWVEMAISETERKGGKSVRYVGAILQRWKSTGLAEPWEKACPPGSKGVLDIIGEMGGEGFASGA